jgi:hypothetical protein
MPVCSRCENKNIECVRTQSRRDYKGPRRSTQAAPEIIKALPNVSSGANQPYNVPEMSIISAFTVRGPDLHTHEHPFTPHLPDVANIASGSSDAIGRGRALASNAELLKWLDRHQKAAVLRNASTNLDHEVGFAATVYQTCLQLFGEMWKSFNKDRNRPRAWQAKTRENLSRLVLWGDLFDQGRLDACLDRSTDIRDCVLEGFNDIGKTLIEGTVRFGGICSYFCCPLLFCFAYPPRTKRLSDV